MTEYNHGVHVSTDLALTTATPAWRKQVNESDEDYFAFLWWVFNQGDLKTDLAENHNWAGRAQTIQTYESLEAVDPSEQGYEAAIARVRITLTEILKLQNRVMSSPENQLDVKEIMSNVDWMTDVAQGISERKAKRLDWTQCTPEERETLLQAKAIQDRLMNAL